jgi:serine/threonine protein kinase
MLSQPKLVEVAEDWCRKEAHLFEGIAGHGAFKETFQVRSPEGDHLALKIYKSDPTYERSRREIEAMKRCDHPNIGRVIAVGTHDLGGKTFGFATERFISGGTLKARLDRGSLSREEVLTIGDKLISGLTHLKDLDLVHRDIKPDNIMLDGDVGTPILVDFGIVRDLQADSLTQTHLARGPGTPLYSSPEQINNDKEMIGWQSDQFSLGIVLALCLLRSHPFDGTGSDLFRLIDEEETGILSAIVGRIGARGGVDQDIARQLRNANLPAVLKLLAPWPVQRFATGRRLIETWNKQRGVA